VIARARHVSGTLQERRAFNPRKVKNDKEENAMRKMFAACAIAALFGVTPAMAADTSTDNKPASDMSSGPGVKGDVGGKNGPAMDADGASGSSGASSGEQGMSPSQDATGVKGAEDSTNGPSDKKPGDTSN